MPLKRYPSDHIIVDGENRPIRFDCAYSLSSMSVDDALSEIFLRHGRDIHLLPLSGASAGAGVFQVDAKHPIIAVHLQAVAETKVSLRGDVKIEAVGLDEIVIDVERRCVYAGSAISLHQLNTALATQLGAQYKVLGADLTSYTYAQVGATFMTGGMGPQRRYFSDSVLQIALHDGGGVIRIESDDLGSYAGTYGWTGIVTAVCCRYVELPPNEIAFALPVNNTADDLAKLLDHLSPLTQLNIAPDSPVSSAQGGNLILGLEHVTSASMQPFLESTENALSQRALQLKQNCEAANADGLIFASGFSDLDADDFLSSLLDDDEADTYTIAGIDLEHTEIFRDPEQMRAIREAIPYAARMQAPQGRFSFKGHTDTNIGLNPACIEDSMRQLWTINQRYVDSVMTYFSQNAAVKGQILVYGHMNPLGVDPHNRVTMACDDENDFLIAVDSLDELKFEFIRQLAKLCDDLDCEFVGGEKGAGSEYEMFAAFPDLDDLPQLLADKLHRQRECIRQTSPLFNWRAMSPYHSTGV